MLYNITHALAVNVDRVSPGSFFLWLVIFFGLVLLETSDTELRSRKVSYLKSLVIHWSGEKMERHDTARVRYLVMMTVRIKRLNSISNCTTWFWTNRYVGCTAGANGKGSWLNPSGHVAAQLIKTHSYQIISCFCQSVISAVDQRSILRSVN